LECRGCRNRVVDELIPCHIDGAAARNDVVISSTVAEIVPLANPRPTSLENHLPTSVGPDAQVIREQRSREKKEVAGIEAFYEIGIHRLRENPAAESAIEAVHVRHVRVARECPGDVEAIKIATSESPIRCTYVVGVT